jgi:hypothetical protein
LKDYAIVKRGQFNSAVQQQARWLGDRRHVVGLDPDLRFLFARVAENHRFLTRTAMPINDPGDSGGSSIPISAAT